MAKKHHEEHEEMKHHKKEHSKKEHAPASKHAPKVAQKAKIGKK